MALAVAVFLGTGDTAKANYVLTATLSITNAGSVTNAAGSSLTVDGTTVTLTNITSPVLPSVFIPPSTNTVNIGNITVTTTATSPPGTSFTVNYVDNLVLVNTPPPGTAQTGTFVLTGTLTLSNITTTSGVITNVFNPPTSASGPFAGFTFTGTALNFASPTVNGGTGSLGGILSSTPLNVIPAPASLVMLGLGLGGVGMIRLRKRHRPRA